MLVSDRISNFSESVTLKLNAKAISLSQEGNKIYNLTAGQLPFRPDSVFTESIKKETNFIKSFQYSPVPGSKDLREKILKWSEKERDLDLASSMDVLISNGAKQVLSTILCSLINPGDEVVIISPYWVSYPPMIKLYGGVVKVVETDFYEHFSPSMDSIREALTSKTKAIIINSPNNPVGHIYDDNWMRDFSQLMQEFPNTIIVSDEIYRELNYYDPGPRYFYQFEKNLLDRTCIVGGISKVMASTGLRIGWCIAPKSFISSMSKLQGHISSGASSLAQQGLLNYDLDRIPEFLSPIKVHLRENSKLLREKLRESDFAHKWYQISGAFYYLIDFSKLPILEKFQSSPDDSKDYASDICDHILTTYGVAMVPGSDFGVKNAARISLVSERDVFSEAIDLILKAINCRD